MFLSSSDVGLGVGEFVIGTGVFGGINDGAGEVTLLVLVPADDDGAGLVFVVLFLLARLPPKESSGNSEGFQATTGSRIVLP